MSHHSPGGRRLCWAWVVLAAVAPGATACPIAAPGTWANSFEVTAGSPRRTTSRPARPSAFAGWTRAGGRGRVPGPRRAGAEVTVRMKLDGKFASRVCRRDRADSRLGARVEGDRHSAGHAAGRGRSPAGGFAASSHSAPTTRWQKFAAPPTRFASSRGAKGLVKDVRDSNGTLMKLSPRRRPAQDIHELVAKTDKAVANLERAAAGWAASSRTAATRPVRQAGTDALSKLPIVRSYVEDSAALMVRPNSRRDMWPFNTRDLFEPGTAILTPDGFNHLNNAAILIKQNTNKNADVVVVAFCDPADSSQTPASAQELTKKQAERVVEHLRSLDVHKMGTFSRARSRRWRWHEPLAGGRETATSRPPRCRSCCSRRNNATRENFRPRVIFLSVPGPHSE